MEKSGGIHAAAVSIIQENERLLHQPAYRDKRRRTLRLRAAGGLALWALIAYLPLAMITSFSGQDIPAWLYPGAYMVHWGDPNAYRDPDFGFLKLIALYWVFMIEMAALFSLGLTLLLSAGTQAYRLAQLKAVNPHDRDESNTHYYLSPSYKDALVQRHSWARRLFKSTSIATGVFWLLLVIAYLIAQPSIHTHDGLKFLAQAFVKCSPFLCALLGILFLAVSTFGWMDKTWRKKVALVACILHSTATPICLIIVQMLRNQPH